MSPSHHATGFPLFLSLQEGKRKAAVNVSSFTIRAIFSGSPKFSHHFLFFTHKTFFSFTKAAVSHPPFFLFPLFFSFPTIPIPKSEPRSNLHGLYGHARASSLTTHTWPCGTGVRGRVVVIFVLRSRGAKLMKEAVPQAKYFVCFCLTADPTGICETSTRVHARQFCDTLAQPITCV